MKPVSRTRRKFSPPPKMSVPALVRELKQTGQDTTEFYPTSDEMLEVIRTDIHARGIQVTDEGLIIGSLDYPNPSILDVGAGNGKALNYLTNGVQYAVEKVPLLLQQLDKDVRMVGTEFHECQIMGAEVEMVFCNPPYSEFEHWTQRIIKEAYSKDIYLVIPKRWVKSSLIKEALKARSAKFVRLAQLDFLKADRSARAVVDIIRVDLVPKIDHLNKELRGNVFNRRYRHEMVAPFDIMFDEAFPSPEIPKDLVTEYETSSGKADLLKEAIHNMVVGRNLIDYLMELYQRDEKAMFDLYKSITELPREVFQELGIDISKIKDTVRDKIAGLKNLYWNELFSNYDDIRNRLTNGSRTKLVAMMSGRTGITFTASNAYAITLSVIKHANSHFDSQLVAVYEDMINEANVVRYKSNQRTFKYDRWSYNKRHNTKLHGYGAVALRDYRVVISKGGIDGSNYPSSHYRGLTSEAFHFVNDLMVIGKNLGWSFNNWQDAGHVGEWVSNKGQRFMGTYQNTETQFMLVRAFKNGNLHISFNSQFILSLNLEMGRLRGWIKSKAEAMSEFDFDLSSKTGDPKMKNLIPTMDKLDQLWVNGLYKLELNDSTKLLTCKKD